MRAKKSLGQNFLRDDAVVKRIVAALDLSEDDTVVEIGPGQGALTGDLLITAGKVVAIEFDRDMVAILNERFAAIRNLELVNRDALSVDFSEVLGPNTDVKPKFVANLPYNISTPILQRLIEQRELFSTIVLMFQREVAERITATPGGKERGFLSVLVENAFETEYLFDVAPTAFTPVPKVWSAVVRLTPKSSGVPDEVLFRRIVSMSFAQKRKTLSNNLKAFTTDAATVLTNAGINGIRRAETLTVNEWIKLTEQFSK